VAIATGGRVGLDVEARDRLNDNGRALLRALSPRDADLPVFRGAGDRDVLVDNWVAKEALLKAVGVGLTRDPREVELGAGFGQGRFLWQAVGADPDFGDSSWTVISLSIAPGYACAMAKEGHAKDVVVNRYLR
jgi:phosphopantetheinyl transferase (holo-ACP synthase)